ncbi:MAG TPA: hypothetical protein VIN38_05850 [Thiobacillus sp.]
MLEIAYHFYVLPRHHTHFRHAYQTTHFTLQQIAGLASHRFSPPQGRHDAFTLRLIWHSRACFDLFTRTWFGVWLVNGMGLSPDALTAPIQTDVKHPLSLEQTGGQAA